VNLDERIDRLLEAIGRASGEDFTVPLEISDEADAFQAIETGVSVLIADLAETKQRNRARALEILGMLRERSTPIIAVWDGVLALPVIGTVDAQRSAEMMGTLLARVVAEKASHVVIDITGVSAVDTQTVDHFARMANAVRLLGAKCFLAGISPTIAQTLAQLGIDTTSVHTVQRLSDALKIAFLDLRVSLSGENQ
jgi:rsbT co-antagonist protein RsbR